MSEHPPNLGSRPYSSPLAIFDDCTARAYALSKPGIFSGRGLSFDSRCLRPWLSDASPGAVVQLVEDARRIVGVRAGCERLTSRNHITLTLDFEGANQPALNLSIKRQLLEAKGITSAMLTLRYPLTADTNHNFFQFDSSYLNRARIPDHNERAAYALGVVVCMLDTIGALPGSDGPTRQPVS